MAGDRGPEQGSIRLGIDVGVSGIVIAACGPGNDCRTLAFPGISREFPQHKDRQPVHIIPSLVEYRDGRVERRGEAARAGGVGDASGNARWLRQYLCDQSPAQISAGAGRMIRYEEAIADILGPLLSDALVRYPGALPVISLPAEAPPEYTDLLQRIARSAGARSCSTVSEYEAVLAGYGYSPSGGESVLIVSFTETGLEAVALARSGNVAASDERGLRVLARATGSASCGGIDSAIARDILEKIRLPASDSRAIRLMPQIRFEASELREHIPLTGDRGIRLTDTVSGRIYETLYTAKDFDTILTACEIIPTVQECIGRVYSALRGRDGAGCRPGAVFLLGAGCAIPSVQNAIRVQCGGAKVCAGHLMDAAARGAAGYTVPRRAADRIMRSYALRYWDPAAQEHHYRFLVHSGTRYPSNGQVARVVISAAYDGQTHLGIPLYEIGGTSENPAPRLELVSDKGGGVRLAGPVQDAETPNQAVCANERSPTLLVATPPARKGEPRFECTFTLDPERNLCLSARDLLTGTLVKVNTPVHRLT